MQELLVGGSPQVSFGSLFVWPPKSSTSCTALMEALGIWDY